MTVRPVDSTRHARDGGSDAGDGGSDRGLRERVHAAVDDEALPAFPSDGIGPGAVDGDAVSIVTDEGARGPKTAASAPGPSADDGLSGPNTDDGPDERASATTAEDPFEGHRYSTGGRLRPLSSWVAGLGRLLPADVDPSGDLERALRFLTLAVSPRDVVATGYLLGALLGAVTTGVLWALGASSMLVVSGGAALALGTAHGVHRLPVAVARLRRTRALGETSGLVGRVALSLRLEPAPERAARFAARTTGGPLSRSLERHVRQSVGTPQAGLTSFAEEWRTWFPPVERACSLLLAAADADGDDRERTLDRALASVVDGTEASVAAFADEVHAPATGLYAFGVFLPLALVATLPALGAAGVSLPPMVLVVVLDVLLPIGVAAGGVTLLLRRPVAFAPPRIPADHPDLPDSRWRPALALLSALPAAVVASALVGPWAGPIAGVGVGVGAALAVYARPALAVHSTVEAAESGLPDALALVGQRVADGEPVERALAETAEDVPDATGAVLSDAADVQRRLGVTVRESFLGDHGALARLPSRRLRGAAGLLSVSASVGRPAGPALVTAADHLATLADLEREARRDLSSVTRTLRHTASVFAPLVAGATVALATGLAGRTPEPGAAAGGAGTAASSGTAALSASGSLTSVAGDAVLGPVLGWYVLVLAVVLTAVSTGLERGLSRPVLASRLGGALLSATGTYLLAVHVARLFF